MSVLVDRFSSEHDCREHLIAVHADAKPYECYICGDRFTRHEVED